MNAYCQSKLANVLFTKELAKKGEGSGVSAYALHPGVINTELGRSIKDTYGVVTYFFFRAFQFLIKTPEAGAQTSLYCCLEEGLEEPADTEDSEVAAQQEVHLVQHLHLLQQGEAGIAGLDLDTGLNVSTGHVFFIKNLQ